MKAKVIQRKHYITLYNAEDCFFQRWPNIMKASLQRRWQLLRNVGLWLKRRWRAWVAEGRGVSERGGQSEEVKKNCKNCFVPLLKAWQSALLVWTLVGVFQALKGLHAFKKNPKWQIRFQGNIIVNNQGNRITLSHVAFTDIERLIGDPTKKPPN